MRNLTLRPRAPRARLWSLRNMVQMTYPRGFRADLHRCRARQRSPGPRSPRLFGKQGAADMLKPRRGSHSQLRDEPTLERKLS